MSAPSYPVSIDDQKRVLGLMWALKPSDFSNLVAMSKKPVTGDPITFMTTRDSAHAMFWSRLVALDLARENPLDLTDVPEGLSVPDGIAAFSPTETGRHILTALLQMAYDTNWVLAHAVIDDTVIAMLRVYAESAQPDSQNKLALLHDRGIAVEKEADAALALFAAAAEQGHMAALNNLGVKYHERGETDAALKCLLMVAEAGDPTAMENIADIYGSGTGSVQDFETAFAWIQKAAAHGGPLALYKLGELYRNGIGTDENPVQAYIWFTLALKAGIDTQTHINQMRDALTADDIAAADAFIAQWAPAGPAS